MNSQFSRPGFRPIFAVCIVATLSFLAAACSAPFTADLLARAVDSTAPIVVIATPDDESYYARTVLVTGSVSDATDTPEVAGEVTSVRYEIPSASIVEDIELDADGNFSFTFSTNSFTGGTITLRVVATDANGNTGVGTRSLLYGGSDIATFEAVPQNQSVLLRWDPVPAATGYAVKNLGTAQTVALSPETSSYTWEALENGDRYFFQLEATDASGQTNISSELSVIPLSAYTLLPTAYSYDDSVVLTWRSMPGIEKYAVEKATDVDGPYQKRFVTSNTSVTDTFLARDQFYYYRVYPEEQDAVRSAPVEAILIPFSVSGTEPGNYFGPLEDAQYIRASGNYLVLLDRETPDYFVRVLDATDPSSLEQVGAFTYGTATPFDLVIDEYEQLAYVTLEELGVMVVDISDPANPVVATMGISSDPYLGRPDPQGNYTFNSLAMTRIGGQSYVLGLGYDTGLSCARVDVAGGEVTLTPVSYLMLGAAPDEGDALAIHGTSAYASIRDDSAASIGFLEIDISDPESGLSTGGAYSVSAGAYSQAALAATGDYVFFGFRNGAGNAYMHAVDATNFSNLLATYSYSAPVISLDIANDTLFVSAGSAGVYGYDISVAPDTDNPSPVVYPDLAGPAYSSLVTGDYLVVAGLTGVESFYLLPAIGYGSSKHTIVAEPSMYDIASIGFNAHILDYGAGGFYTADITNPESLTAITNVPTLAGGAQLILQGDREILFSTQYQLETMQIITPPSGTAPQMLYEVDHDARELYSIGDISYGIKNSIISIFDTSDSSAISHVRSIGFDKNIFELAARGNYLYAAYLNDESLSVRDSGIIVLDISDPIYPVEVNRVSAAATIAFHDMKLFDDKLYLAFSDNGGTPRDPTGDSSGLYIYDVGNDPQQPTLRASPYIDPTDTGDSRNWSSRFELVQISGHLAILSSGFTANAYQYNGRIVLLNVADPDNPYKIKDVLPDTGYAAVGLADFPQRIHFWRGAYLFVMGRLELSVYGM